MSSEISGACIDGPFGGSDGDPFYARSQGLYIKEIHICQTGDPSFPSIAAGFDLTFNETSSMIEVGCYDKQSPYRAVSLMAGEVITVVDIYTGTTNANGVVLVEGLTFRTNLPFQYGPFGLTSGTKTTSYGERLNGIVGRAGNALNQISLIWEASDGCGETFIF